MIVNATPEVRMQLLNELTGCTLGVDGTCLSQTVRVFGVFDTLSLALVGFFIPLAVRRKTKGTKLEKEKASQSTYGDEQEPTYSSQRFGRID